MVRDDTDFHEVFKSRYNLIIEGIETNGWSSEHLLKETEELQKLVQKRVDRLTKYDQEKYGISLQSLRERIWKRKRPSKFQFKTKIAKPESTLKSSTLTQCSKPSTEPILSPSPRVARNQYQESMLSNASISDLENSTVIYKDVQGAVYIDNVVDSKLYLRAQQCRVHNSADITIWLEKCSSPILENCRDIRFIVPESDFQVFDFDSSDQRNYTVTKVPEDEWLEISTLSENDLN